MKSTWFVKKRSLPIAPISADWNWPHTNPAPTSILGKSFGLNPALLKYSHHSWLFILEHKLMYLLSNRAWAMGLISLKTSCSGDLIYNCVKAQQIPAGKSLSCSPEVLGFGCKHSKSL